MKGIAQYLAPYKKESVLGPLFKLMEAGFELMVPLVMASLIDLGVKPGDKGHILEMSLILVLLALVGLVCSVTAQYFAAKAAVGFTARLREALFSKVTSLSYADLDRIGTPTLLTRMTSDMNQVQTGLNLGLRLFLRSPFVVFGAAIMALTVDAKTAAVFAVLIPLLAVVVYGIMLVSMPLHKKAQEKLERLVSVTRSNLTGVRVVRAFRREQEQTGAFGDINRALTEEQKTVGRISALQSPVTGVLVNLAIAILLQKGAIRVESGALTQGQVIALYNYLTQILVELVKLANLIVTVTKSVACGKRIGAILSLTPSVRDGDGTKKPVPGAPKVEFDGVSLRYPGGGEEALHGISFRVQPGEVVGIIGGTGAGKTSLVSLIPRFYEASGGEVRIDGIPAADYRLGDLRNMIAVVPQKALLFHGTIRDNLKWGKADATEEELLDACRAAQALSVLQEKEEGLDTMLAPGGRNLSGGQRQRLTIARALLKKPQILILDDASSALDYATDAALRQSLASLPSHPTLFLVSQRTNALRHADHILVLEDGRMEGWGTHEELLSSCEAYREMHEMQEGRT